MMTMENAAPPEPGNAAMEAAKEIANTCLDVEGSGSSFLYRGEAAAIIERALVAERERLEARALSRREYEVLMRIKRLIGDDRSALPLSILHVIDAAPEGD